MGTINTAVANSFKVELLKGVHNFTASSGHTFKVALFRAIASVSGDYGAATTKYGDLGDDELPTGTGYTRGGKTLASVTPVLSGSVAVCDFGEVTWTSASFATAGGVIYNDTAAGKPVCAVFSFGGDQSVASGDFSLRFPAATASTAIIRVE